VLRNERLDLRDTTRSAIESLGPFMEEHATRLVVHMDDEPIPVFGDPARLQQVQANLLSNASKYSPTGSEVRLDVRREGDDAIVRVSDAGRGIEPEVLPRIFELFVQGKQSIERPEGGLGIGLTLARSLIELHQGTVDAQSPGIGCGSVFTVRIPLASTSVASVPRVAARPPVKTVVLVEDQADARRMMQLLLEADGRRVFTADNGQTGVELIERLRPDLAIVDLGLPVMSGFELARRIRRNRELRGMRLIALSGYGQDADIQAALEAGFDQHLTKPPDPERLERLLAGTDGNIATQSQ